MTDKDKLKELKKLADAMYYAAQQLTTDASRLHKAMEDYHRFIVNDYHKEDSVNKERFVFKALLRLLEMIKPTERAEYYIAKLAYSLGKEGYATDAKLVRETIKIMNGEKVGLAVMDEKPVSEDAPFEPIGIPADAVKLVNIPNKKEPTTSVSKETLDSFDFLEQSLAKFAIDFTYKGKTLKECLDKYKSNIIAAAHTIEPTIPDIVDEHYWEMLGEEPVSEDLEEAAEDAMQTAIDTESPYTDGEGMSLYPPEYLKSLFIEGAQWQKQQMMKESVDVKIRNKG